MPVSVFCCWRCLPWQESENDVPAEKKPLTSDDEDILYILCVVVHDSFLHVIPCKDYWPQDDPSHVLYWADSQVGQVNFMMVDMLVLSIIVVVIDWSGWLCPVDTGALRKPLQKTSRGWGNIIQSVIQHAMCSNYPGDVSEHPEKFPKPGWPRVQAQSRRVVEQWGSDCLVFVSVNLSPRWFWDNLSIKPFLLHIPGTGAGLEEAVPAACWFRAAVKEWHDTTLRGYEKDALVWWKCWKLGGVKDCQHLSMPCQSRHAILITCCCSAFAPGSLEGT